MPHLGAWRHPLLAFSLVIVGIGLLVGGAFLLAVALTPTPDIASFASRELAQSTKLYDRTGQVLLYDYNKDARRAQVSLKDISPSAINATIAIEDSSFYEHGGIRFTSIIRAAIADFIGGSFSQGGSTITQQVVKNTLLTNKKSIVRKVHEWILATRLEESYSKDQILETYMNSIPYGGILYGIGAASEAYFGVPPKDLTLAEAAYLAAMIQAPSYYSPYGAHRAQLDARKNVVLERMKTLGFIADEDVAKAKGETVTFAPNGAAGIIAPHFVFYILNQLEETYGANALQSGLKVTTTLDASLQAKEEEIIQAGALKNAANGGATNAALVALDPQTGQILAMVGSRDFFDTDIDGQYNATLALRQPGSTMKPFAYVTALMHGYTRDTVVFDVPTQFSTACNPTDVYNQKPPCYAPKNYDNTYRGPMTFETALAMSINIPAVKVVYLAGVKNVIDLAHSFGLSTIGDAKQCGLTVVIGGCEVRLLDLVDAYAAFGAGGVRNPPTGILEVDAADGSVLAKYEAAPTRVIPESYANDINAMLSDVQARIPEYRPGGMLDVPGYEVAVKTGTTDNSRDAWTVGYTPSVAVGIWVGNNDNTPATSLAGLVAAPIWNKAMAAALPNYPQRYFGVPNPIPPSVPPMLRGDFMSVGLHSLLYSVDKTDPRGGPPGNPAGDPQFAAWEYGIQAYATSHPGLFYNPPLLVPLSYGEAPPSSSTTDSFIPSL
jgi:penicillin-binding protein 1C